MTNDNDNEFDAIDDDAGADTLMVTHHNGMVTIQFPEELTAFGLDPEEARKFAQNIMAVADLIDAIRKRRH